MVVMPADGPLGILSTLRFIPRQRKPKVPLLRAGSGNLAQGAPTVLLSRPRSSRLPQKRKRREPSAPPTSSLLANPELSGASLLEFHSPELRPGIRQFQTQLPASSSLVTPPDQRGLRDSSIHRVQQFHLLPYRESLRDYRQTPFRADIHRVTLRTVRLALFVPLHGDSNARIHPSCRAHVVQHLQRVIHLTRDSHVFLRFPRSTGRQSPARLAMNAHPVLRSSPTLGLQVFGVNGTRRA
jgi:hypothetical protein